MVPYDRCFRTLANPLRIRIIELLKKRPMAVGELSKQLNAERSKVSHALKKLKECNFVESERRGKYNIYSLTKSVLNDVKVKGNIFDVIKTHVEKYCKNKRRCRV
ncbi:MAG: winged helix-turn-helix transcriptional regulator [Candidatus Diapherotrites archaeon]|uniref:ArsR family transcriptional regulator n=1 Tax=Candidatus Iainarchaeum sp. TaxID=3101447 RepID=A0A497JFZ9_9ARCH|nr:winged helix-turn-helix transcriptional regulator [Candidatus Diapherotrites archaeon]RLG69895.1 MAG: ArsR family transcriptional regulator [Candidatus Diapherotrites archaeon]